ncbi:hypothetical protein Btru_069382 [Bulinus truncatus]|nr:hypothetical protein Btru_069382 [Bulinus truncatus]
MGIRSSKILHSDQSKQVKSREKRQVIYSGSLSKDEITSQSVVIPNQHFHLYGHHETQVSEGGEADLHKHLKNCQKNSDHKQFVPVKFFSIKDLPEKVQDNVLYQLNKATVDLTVRVDVKMTSPHRPEFYPDTKVPYPFYNMRNKTTLRLGTGEIHVYKYIDGRGVDSARMDCNVDGEQYLSLFDTSTRTCPCTKCRHSDKPRNVWWEFIVVTATHVVFDDIEPSHTSCRLFYDGQDSPVVSLDKVSVHYVDIERDTYHLKFVTCGSLGNNLFNIELRWLYLWRKVRNKYKKISDIKMTYIVSHTHGCHKQVSIGRLMVNYKFGECNKNIDFAKLTYTTSTCPGSSGARVYCLGSGNGALDSGLNYSCVGLYMK